MNPTIRLRFIAGLILLSAVYALIISESPEVASAVALGYVAIVLTILVALRWKKPY